jgi:universal stress protein F
VPGGLLEERVKEAQTLLDGIARTSGLNAEARVLRGHAAQSILDVAEDVGADLIVVASHRPGLSDYLLGSTASRVVRHANCSVLVVR